MFAVLRHFIDPLAGEPCQWTHAGQSLKLSVGGGIMGAVCMVLHMKLFDTARAKKFENVQL